ncbi:MAG TPA: 4-alpha-glucanotransferase [Verrucomicrobiae bacterium]|nr:4-alpha-glucanotransferase [Verrucomicrobiae bacterium]
MAESALHRLAERAGLVVQWRDYRGNDCTVPDATLRAVLAALGLSCDDEAAAREQFEQLREEPPAPLLTAVAGSTVRLPGMRGPLTLVCEGGVRLSLHANDSSLVALADDCEPGYHQVDDGRSTLRIAVAPAKPYDATAGRRLWGLAAQLYGLRRAGGGGVGDYTALTELAAAAASQGADALCISPVHAPFDAEPRHFSPYAPSSRLFLNAWHVDPSALVGAGACKAMIAELGLAEDLARCDALPLVDWPAVVTARRRLLRGLFDQLRGKRLSGSGGLAQELANFRASGGVALERHARFEALQAHVLAHGGAWHWREWPAPLRDPAGPGVRELAQRLSSEVDFHVFLQWLANHGLAGAQAAAKRGGMRIGLVADLAVGTHDGGSHAWSHRDDLLSGVSVGAPPDELNTQGQAWGLTHFSPRALRAHGFQPFIDMLRAALRHAGGVRIDHILGLNRLWLVPQGAAPHEGCYLRYPLEDLLRLIRLEADRHQALVIGEDLGTVPEGFRERMDEAGVLGLRVLWFERDHGLFSDPSQWSRRAVATTSTHDVASVAGWWQGGDIEWRQRTGQPPSEVEDARVQRAVDRRALWAAFTHTGVAKGPAPSAADDVVDAAIRQVARAPSALAIVPLEDLCAEAEQPNLPGTTTEHPNWRRRSTGPVDKIFDDEAVAARLESLRQERPS